MSQLTHFVREIKVKTTLPKMTPYCKNYDGTVPEQLVKILPR